MESLKNFVDKLCALEIGSTASITEKNVSAQALFGALLENELRARIDPNVWKQTDRVVSQYFKAVLLCREHKLVDALVQLNESDSSMSFVPTDMLDYTTLFKLSAWGNYFYKVNEPAKAIALLQEGLQISAGLERCGYFPLIYRRIEQIQNIANIYFKQQDHESGNNLLRNTIQFVHSGVSNGMFIDDWDAATLKRVHALQEITFRGLIAQLASRNSAYIHHKEYNDKYYYNFFFRPILQNLEADTHIRLVTHNWLFTKASFYNQNLEAFLSNSLEFISDPCISSTYDNLKANLLGQVIHSIKGQKGASCHQEMIDSVTLFARHHLSTSASDAFIKTLK